ncbi:hypothetical protein [Rhodococcus sp. NPDC058521]|uniref:hypothetical protein n=1 Tax=Rhodococcus sp. NPDC058521 TaxID=3346536 RepID=UPI00365F0E2B
MLTRIRRTAVTLAVAAAALSAPMLAQAAPAQAHPGMPTSVVAPSGELYVVDTPGNRVMKFAPGQLASTDLPFDRPTNVAVGAEGVVVVTDAAGDHPLGAPAPAAAPAAPAPAAPAPSDAPEPPDRVMKNCIGFVVVC